MYHFGRYREKDLSRKYLRKKNLSRNKISNKWLQPAVITTFGHCEWWIEGKRI